MQLKATNESPFRHCVSTAVLLASQLTCRTMKILQGKPFALHCGALVLETLRVMLLIFEHHLLVY